MRNKKILKEITDTCPDCDNRLSIYTWSPFDLGSFYCDFCDTEWEYKREDKDV